MLQRQALTTKIPFRFQQGRTRLNKENIYLLVALVESSSLLFLYYILIDV